MALIRPGRKLGPYLLDEHLGEGSSADVWLAYEEVADGTTRPLALKILHHPATARASSFHHLLNEVRIAGKLGDPRIVEVYGVAQLDEHWLVAMEFVDGTNLAELLLWLGTINLRVPLSVVVDFGIALCEGLDHAHRAKDESGRALRIVHRDLKPANILIGRSGQVKITDFGLAKATTSVSSTKSGTLKGSPPYIAPETWKGERDFHPRVDLFALGAILWEMAIGRRLFDGENIPALAMNVFSRSPADEAKALAHERSPALAAIVERLLARDPRTRTQGADQVLGELRELRKGIDAAGTVADFMRLLQLLCAPPSANLPRAESLGLNHSHDPDWAALVSAVVLPVRSMVPLEALSPGRRLQPAGSDGSTGSRPDPPSAAWLARPGDTSPNSGLSLPAVDISDAPGFAAPSITARLPDSVTGSGIIGAPHDVTEERPSGDYDSQGDPSGEDDPTLGGAGIDVGILTEPSPASVLARVAGDEDAVQTAELSAPDLEAVDSSPPTLDAEPPAPAPPSQADATIPVDVPAARISLAAAAAVLVIAAVVVAVLMMRG